MTPESYDTTGHVKWQALTDAKVYWFPHLVKMVDLDSFLKDKGWTLQSRTRRRGLAVMQLAPGQKSGTPFEIWQQQWEADIQAPSLLAQWGEDPSGARRHSLPSTDGWVFHPRDAGFQRTIGAPGKSFVLPQLSHFSISEERFISKIPSVQEHLAQLREGLIDEGEAALAQKQAWLDILFPLLDKDATDLRHGVLHAFTEHLTNVKSMPNHWPA